MSKPYEPNELPTSAELHAELDELLLAPHPAEPLAPTGRRHVAAYAELRRLYAEELPTGRFGGPFAVPPRTSPEEAAAHRAVIEAAYRRGGEAA